MQAIDVGKNGSSGAVAWFGGSGMSLRGTGTGLRVRGFGHVSSVRLSLLRGGRSPLRSSALSPLSMPQPRCFHFGVVTEWQTDSLAVNHKKSVSYWHEIKLKMWNFGCVICRTVVRQ